jgi:2,3-bisphosphoglycerate-independent phosphoglycerate mutase
VKFRTDIKVPGVGNVANLHGFEAPVDYEATLIEVADN